MIFSKIFLILTIYVFRVSSNEQIFDDTNLQQTNDFNFLTTTYGGFTIKYTNAVSDKKKFWDQIKGDIDEINRILPKEVLDVLYTVRIYVNHVYYYGGVLKNGCHAHYSAEWLTQNGNIAEKAGHVEVYSDDDYVNWEIQQPAMLFHELVHQYHWKFQTRTYPLTTAAYNKAMSAGKYQSVKYIDGRMFKAYATTNHIEYLAEVSEAYFSSKRFRNDYFPIVRSQLKTYDLDAYKMVEQVFQLSKTFISNLDKNVVNPTDYNVKTQTWTRQ